MQTIQQLQSEQIKQANIKLNTTISTETKSKLLEYQIPHSQSLIHSLIRHNRALDASDTGTGKTYSTVAVARTLGLRLFIVCPKSVINSWVKVLNHFGFPLKNCVIANYELLLGCKCYHATNTKERLVCEFVTRQQVKDKRSKRSKKKQKFRYVYKWSLPSDYLLVFDEAHRAKNTKTHTSVLLYTAARRVNNKILLLSATIADKPEFFELCGFVLGLYYSLRMAKRYIAQVGSGYSNPIIGVHKKLYPEFASRMRIIDLLSLFPDNKVVLECYDMDDCDEIQRQYDIIADAVRDLSKQELKSFALGKIIKARMKIEMLRVPKFLKIIQDHLNNGKAVAVFVNFTDTLLTLKEKLKTNCVVYGKQTLEERDQNIDDFNSDRSHIIILNIRAGGVGISLHDTHGDYPRISVISPSWSAQDFLQAIGRVFRAGGKSVVEQQIIFCKGTIEESICERMKEKIQNIGSLNDGNLKSYQIKGLIEDDINDDVQNDNDEFTTVFSELSDAIAKKKRLEDSLVEVNDKITTLEKLLNSLMIM